MGVILFLMVTGSLPYTTEANIQDPLYKLIYQKKKAQYWATLRKLNSSEGPETHSNSNIVLSGSSGSIQYIASKFKNALIAIGGTLKMATGATLGFLHSRCRRIRGGVEAPAM